MVGAVDVWGPGTVVLNSSSSVGAAISTIWGYSLHIQDMEFLAGDPAALRPLPLGRSGRGPGTGLCPSGHGVDLRGRPRPRRTATAPSRPIRARARSPGTGHRIGTRSAYPGDGWGDRVNGDPRSTPFPAPVWAPGCAERGRVPPVPQEPDMAKGLWSPSTTAPSACARRVLAVLAGRTPGFSGSREGMFGGHSEMSAAHAPWGRDGSGKWWRISCRDLLGNGPAGNRSRACPRCQP